MCFHIDDFCSRFVRAVDTVGVIRCEILNDQDNKMDTAVEAAAAQVYDDNVTSGEDQLVALDKMCRLCCSDGEVDLSVLFPEGSSYHANQLLLKKIYECTTVQVSAASPTLMEGKTP